MKKRISIIVALVLILTNLLSVVSFANFSDVPQESTYREAIITLTKLGVINGYDDGTFKPEGAITRAEFTKMIMTALGRGDATTEPTEFSDINGHWAKYYIKNAYDMDIINGFPDGTFAPDAQVTYEQALKMVVCALGYVDFAEDKGGYPIGYKNQAKDLKLTEGISGQGDSEPALRQVIAQVVFNALDVEKRHKDRNGNWQLTGETILSDDLDMIKLTGVLVGVEDVVTEDCTKNLLQYQMAVEDKNKDVVIDTRQYKDMTISGLQNYVGNEVTVYYRIESTGENSLVIFDADTVENTTQTILSEDILSYSGTTLKYFQNGGSRERSMTVKADEVTVIYNGQTLSADDTYDLISKKDGSQYQVTGKKQVLVEILDSDSDYKLYGDVTVTDSGSDGVADMITINDYRWMIAHKNVATIDYMLQNTLNVKETLILDPDDPDIKVYVEKGGKEVAPTAILKGDVVTYTQSFDGKTIKAYASKETAKGKVAQMSEDEITIGTKVYKIDQRCIELVKSKTGKDLEVGKTVTAYVDKLGTVVYAEISEEASAPYAYIANFGIDSSDESLYVTAFIPSVSKTSVSTYSLAKRVKVNGSVIESDQEAYDILLDAATYNNPDAPGETDGYTGTEGENTDKSQVARIKVVDEDGKKKISEIVTLDGEAEGNNSNTSTIVRGEGLGQFTYTSGRFMLNGQTTKFSANSSTTVIYVPADRTDKNGYAVKTYSTFTGEAGNKYWLEAFDINDNRYAGLIIRYGAGDATLNNVWVDSSFSIVGGTSATEYDEEESTTVASIPLYTNSTSTKSWKVHSSVTDTYTSLDLGDVIQYDYDSDNKLQTLYPVISYADIKEVLDEGTYAWDKQSQTQNAANRWQRYVFDFKYPKSDPNEIREDMDKYYVTTSSSSNIARSRAAMFNVLRVIPDENKLQVTSEGFVDGKLVPDNYEDVVISTSTPIIKAVKNASGNITKFTQYEDDGETKLSINSFLEADDYDTACSKILVISSKGSVKMVVIYE